MGICICIKLITYTQAPDRECQTRNIDSVGKLQLIARKIFLLAPKAEGLSKKHVGVEHVTNLLPNLVGLCIWKGCDSMCVA